MPWQLRRKSWNILLPLRASLPFLPHPGHGACSVLSLLARVRRQTRQARELTVPVVPGAACAAREGETGEERKIKRRRIGTVLHVINVSFKTLIPRRSTIGDGDQEALPAIL